MIDPWTGNPQFLLGYKGSDFLEAGMITMQTIPNKDLVNMTFNIEIRGWNDICFKSTKKLTVVRPHDYLSLKPGDIVEYESSEFCGEAQVTNMSIDTYSNSNLQESWTVELVTIGDLDKQRKSEVEIQRGYSHWE